MGDGGQRGSERLDSWKAIATYLNRDERTVRRWERDRGLPVRRVPGGRGTSVFAFASEIDAWLKNASTDSDSPAVVTETSAPQPAARPRRWQIALIAAIVVGITVAGAWRLRSAPVRAEDLHVRLTEDGITAIDRNGREVWRRPFAADYKTSIDSFSPLAQVVGGANPAVFAAYALRVRRSDDRLEEGQLQMFSPAGELRRTFAFTDRATFDRQEYGPPWGITAIAVDDRGGSRRIAIAAHHMRWSASMVTILDGEFHRQGTYWQWGWIEFVAWLTPDRLLVGGFNDARDGGTVALLDPNRLNGQSPEEPGAHGYCETCGPVVPLRMAVMPRSEVNRVTVSRFNRAVVQLESDRIVARTIEVPSAGAEAVDALYEFTPDLDLTRAAFGGPYWELHEALHARGQIAHDREHCPDLRGPREILTWQPSTGWQHVALNRSE